VNVELLTESRKKVEQELESLREIFKQDGKKRKEALYRDLQKVYGHLQHGKKIIDLFEAMKKGGLNQDGDPKLAIARADLKQIYCHKNERGGCMFSQYESSWNRHKGTKISGDLTIPEGTFRWIIDTSSGWRRIKNERIKAPVPLIPCILLLKEVRLKIQNYYILWELEKWEPLPPRDPILLIPLTPNLYGVIATWNLTELERAIIRGRLSERN
jgi:hypothetical protein